MHHRHFPVNKSGQLGYVINPIHGKVLVRSKMAGGAVTARTVET